MPLIPPDDIAQILNMRVLRLASKMSLIFQRETLRPAGLSVQQWRVLVSLGQFGELHLRALARYSTLDPAHTSRVVKSMIDKDWIASRPDDQDQRRIQYTLTSKGQSFIIDYWPDAKQFAADIADLYDTTEFDLFKDFLDRASVACDARLQAPFASQKG